MSAALLSDIAQILAILACSFGGALGGYVLARPEDAIGLVGLRRDNGSLTGLGEARAFGGLLLAGHGGVAAALGYAPSMGAVMAFSLALVWLGAACGRILSLVLDKPPAPLDPGEAGLDPPATAPTGPRQRSAARGLLSLDLLMAASLALPLWMLVAPTLRHTGIEV